MQLTTLHSASADEPHGGHDGGPVGVRYKSVARGAVSHGCVRMGGDAVDAINTLPLGTMVEIVAWQLNRYPAVDTEHVPRSLAGYAALRYAYEWPSGRGGLCPIVNA